MKKFLLWLFLLPLMILAAPLVIVTAMAAAAFLYGLFFAGWVAIGAFVVVLLEYMNL